MQTTPTLKKVAVVTGANRGIGLEVSRQLARLGHHVIATSRDPKKAVAATETFAREKLPVEFFPLEVTNEKSIHDLRRHLEEKNYQLTILVNNAGVFPSPNDPTDADGHSAFAAKLSTVRLALETNLCGPYELCRTLLPLMEANRFGRVVNVSSGMGQLSEMEAGFAPYRISKTALNAVTRIFSQEVSGQNILINSACPGWVATEMGGKSAPRTVEQGADTIVWLATLPDGGPTGGFFRDRKPIAW